MKKATIVLIYLFTIMLLPFQAISQQIDSSYIPPLRTPTKLSASFGELRANHFHSGLDFKTEQRIGLPVYSIADGYVSRISVMPNGYGKALYITHPDGYTSVYAHLSKFNDEIDSFIKSKQYAVKSFSINIDTLSPSRFILKKGDLIAYSGNTGSSGGPHLHFEIRETSTECPIIPIYESLKIKDKTAPTINRIKLCTASNATKIAGKHSDKKFDTKLINGKLTINDGMPIHISGGFHIGINAFDQTDGEPNKNGVRGYKIFVDDSLVYTFDIDKIDFATTRFINTVMDYYESVTNKSDFYRTFISQNNRLTYYKTNLSNGVFVFNDNKIHKFNIVVYDHFNNQREVSFSVKAEPILTPGIVNTSHKGVEFKWNKFNSHETKGFKIEMSPESLFDDVDFTIEVKPKQSNTLSSIYVTDRCIPLMKSVNISIDGANVPEQLKSQSFIVNINKDGKRIYVGGEWDEKKIKAKTSSLGQFAIACDTVAPKITPVNIVNNKSVKDQNTIKLTITDDFSGIDTIIPKLNNEWILMDWDPKTSSLTYNFDDKLLKGTNVFNIKVTDKAGNQKTLEMKLIN